MSPPTRKGGQERENPMKKLLFVIALMSAGRVWAVAPIGPAASTLEKGQLELGFDYAHTKFDDLPMDVTFRAWRGSLGSYEFLLDGKMDGYWAKVGYGLADPLDIFLRLGVADLEVTGAEFAWGLGSRLTIAESERLDWGVLAQVNWFGATQEGTIQTLSLGPAWSGFDLDYTALQIAAGPVYKGDGLSIYGGPFLYWLRIDGDAILILLNGARIGGPIDYESDVRFGGYVGLSAELADHLSIGAEAQLAADSQTFAFDLTWRF